MANVAFNCGIQTPEDLLFYVYGRGGARENWKKEKNHMNLEIHRKVLHDGETNFARTAKIINLFLIQVDLPLAQRFEHPEHEGLIKPYLVLDISENDWKTTMKAMRNLCKFYDTPPTLARYFKKLNESQSPKEKMPLTKNEEIALNIYKKAKSVIQRELAQ